MRYVYFFKQQREHLHEKLSESEKLMKEMSQTWEEKLIKTGNIVEAIFEFRVSINFRVERANIYVCVCVCVFFSE